MGSHLGLMRMDASVSRYYTLPRVHVREGVCPAWADMCPSLAQHLGSPPPVTGHSSPLTYSVLLVHSHPHTFAQETLSTSSHLFTRDDCVSTQL